MSAAKKPADAEGEREPSGVRRRRDHAHRESPASADASNTFVASAIADGSARHRLPCPACATSGDCATPGGRARDRASVAPHETRQGFSFLATIVITPAVARKL